MSIGYFFIVVSFWKQMGSYVFLFAMFPLIVNISIFSHTFLNYISLLVFSFLALYLIRVPLDYVFYESTFWGVQGILLAVTIFIAILRRVYMPVILSSRQQWIQRFINSRDNIMVEYNCRNQTISYLNSAACRLYGWNKKDILKKTLAMIHPINFFENPPYQFFEKMKQGISWHGFITAVDKNGNIFEERAVYQPVLDDQKRLIYIEKRVIEAFYKHEYKLFMSSYKHLFEHLNMPAVIINSAWDIEQSNHLFIQKFAHNLSDKSSILSLFPNEIHHKLTQSINQAFLGEESSFTDIAQEKNQTFHVKFSFIPYKPFEKSQILHVFILLEEIKKDQVLKDMVPKERVDISLLFKDILNQIHQQYQNELGVRLFMGYLPNVYSNKDLWNSLIMNILLLASRFSTKENPVKITVTCSVSFNIHFFKIIYECIDTKLSPTYFSDESVTNPNTPLEALKIIDVLGQLSAKPIVSVDNNKTILSFNFQE